MAPGNAEKHKVHALYPDGKRLDATPIQLFHTMIGICEDHDVVDAQLVYTVKKSDGEHRCYLAYVLSKPTDLLYAGHMMIDRGLEL